VYTIVYRTRRVSRGFFNKAEQTWLSQVSRKMK
jgi:hypothetical protein